MADSKLSALTSAGAYSDSDLLYIVQGGVSYKTTYGALKAAILLAKYPEVANYAALPAASGVSGQTYVCLAAQGTYFINRKPAGFYYSDGASWSYVGELPENYFTDSILQISDDADPTKICKFQLSSITTGTTRTLTVPDASGTIALGSGLTATALILGNGSSSVQASDVTYSTPTLSVPASFAITGAGSLAFNAGGSNQNITLTPSGTGGVNVGTSKAVSATGTMLVGATTTTARAQLQVGGTFAIDAFGFAPSVFGRRMNTSLSSPGAVTSGQGLLVLSGGGYNSSAFVDAGAAITMSAAENWGGSANGASIAIQTTPTGSTSIANSLTISNGAAAVLTGGAGNMTIVSGTGASRTLTFQTTTSGSTATTALTLNADQSATFAAAISNGTSGVITTGTIELGNASDTTISRVSAGVIAVEGATVYTQGGALGTPASGTLTNCTLPANKITAGTLAADITFGENTSLVLDQALSADGKYCGITEVVTAGETIAFGEAVYLKAADSRYWLTDADADATAGAVKIAIAVTSGTAGNAMTVLHYGKIRADAKFPTFTIGAPVYLSTTAGALTSTQPSGTDDVIRICGHALTADEIEWKPDGAYFTHT